jgi:rod shape-determining protein MreB and related proteins
VSILSRKIGIDLGSSGVRVYVKGEGVVVNEPLPEAPDSARTLHSVIGRTAGRPRLFRPEVIVSVPASVGSAERRAVTEAVISAGARQVWLIDEALAAALGAGLPIAERRASAVCDIGASRTEIAVISMSGTVAARSVTVGGRHLDHAIASHLAATRGVSVDEEAAERIKIAAGSAMPMREPLVVPLDGIEVTSNDIAVALSPCLEPIAAAIRDVVAEVPRRLAADVGERGIVLSGGTAQLRGLARFIEAHAGVRALVAEEPQTTVVRGAGVALERFEVLKRNQTYVR